MSLSKHDATHLARECLKEDNGFNYQDWVIAAQKLSRMFLSGDHKREIENAAFERAARWCEREDIERDPDDLYSGRAHRAAAIRALIQPPAQPEGK